MNEPKAKWKQAIVFSDGLKCLIEIVIVTGSFITIPNGLRQHPLALKIIPSALTKGFGLKLPDPSNI